MRMARLTLVLVAAVVATFGHLTFALDAISCPAGEEYGLELTVTSGTECISNSKISDFSSLDSSYTACCGTCAIGTVKADVSDAACATCSAGHTNNTALTACEACPVGTYSGTPGSACAACPPLTYSNFTGASFCFPCPVYGRPNTERTGCLCLPATYMVNGDCYPCPRNVNCTASGTVAATATCLRGTPYVDTTTGIMSCTSAAAAVSAAVALAVTVGAVLLSVAGVV